jgi:probable phosphoglycerate mutase
MMLRVGAALDQLIAKHEGETVVIACHGGVIRSAFTALAPVAPEMWTRMSNTNTGITEWLRTETLPTDVFNAQAGQWLLIRHNDAAHLAGL